MNQNVKITRQQVAEEAKMLEKVFDVVRFLEGDFFEQMQKVICLHPHAVKLECVSAMIFGRRINHVRIVHQ